MFLSRPGKLITNIVTPALRSTQNIYRGIYGFTSQHRDYHGEIKEGIILGLGNPLLDFSATVDEDLLKKYDLKPNNAIMAEPKHMPLYKELMEKYNVEYIAGGSVQNTMRVIQWMLKTRHVTTYMGCVGDDDFAKILRDKAEGDGVHVLYQVTTKKPTGTCAVLLTKGGTNRSLCANLAAAKLFTPDHLLEPSSKEAIENARVIYTSGFFLSSSSASLITLAKRAHEKNLLFIFNVSAAFVFNDYKDPLEKMLPYVDLLFGNDEEAEAFARVFGPKVDALEDIAIAMAAYPKENKKRPRVAVVTRGAKPILVARKGKVQTFPVKALKSEEIGDTNSAGDSFTGGFISQLVMGKSLKQCIAGGVYAAEHVIKSAGCTLTGVSDFKPSNK